MGCAHVSFICQKPFKYFLLLFFYLDSCFCTKCFFLINVSNRHHVVPSYLLLLVMYILVRITCFHRSISFVSSLVVKLVHHAVFHDLWNLAAYLLLFRIRSPYLQKKNGAGITRAIAKTAKTVLPLPYPNLSYIVGANNGNPNPAIDRKTRTAARAEAACTENASRMYIVPPW